ncbi:hypothetical protein [Chlorogloeopsis sp. ULAP02]|uniref:hypothetical protein n=1 Tax=Chlorogloeopsis sp. ULAP02 TaxID=3107926 RepID=UPI003134BDAF
MPSAYLRSCAQRLGASSRTYPTLREPLSGNGNSFAERKPLANATPYGERVYRVYCLLPYPSGTATLREAALRLRRTGTCGNASGVWVVPLP